MKKHYNDVLRRMDWRVSICSISILIGASALHAGPGSRSGKSTHVALQKCKVAEIPVEATKIVQHSDNKQHCIQEIIESIATSHPQTLPFLVRNLTQACPEEASLIKNSAQKSFPPYKKAIEWASKHALSSSQSGNPGSHGTGNGKGKGQENGIGTKHPNNGHGNGNGDGQGKGKGNGKGKGDEHGLGVCERYNQ